ncbi:MAG: sensor histidine kinase [Marmoricola sp.]
MVQYLAAIRRVSSRDIALLGVVGLVGQQEAWFPIAGTSVRPGPAWFTALTFALSTAVLAWRRQAPLACLTASALILTAAGLSVGFAEGLAPLLPLVIGCYAIGRWGTRRQLAAGLAVTVVAVILHLSGHTSHGPAALVLLPLLVIAGAAIIGRVLRARAQREDLLIDRLLESDETGHAMALRAVAAERSRISDELHDLVGHGLSVILIQAMAARASLESASLGATDRNIAAVETTARETLEEMRRLVEVTSESSAASFRPTPRLRDLGELVQPVREAGVDVELTITPNLRPIPPGLEATVYRIVQEALTNAIKHADRPVTATIDIRDEEDGLVARVRSGGTVIRPPVAGHGIKGMKKRAELYQGRVEVITPPTGGVCVEARFPHSMAVSP